MFPSRRAFPQPEPLVCVAFVTCGGHTGVGTSELVRTYPAAVHYLEAQLAGSEAGSTGAASASLPYELVWFDNGSSEKERRVLLSRGAQFETIIMEPENVGLFRASNRLWFRGEGCRARYVLNLEDDRMPRPGMTGAGQPHLALAISALQEDATLAGVRLKDEWSDLQVVPVC